MTDAPELKRHEWKLPMANWLRDQINEVLSRYDIPSDVYEQDVQIDALCVIAVDKITAGPTALDRAKREARVEGMRAALDICESYGASGRMIAEELAALIDAERGEGE